MQQSSGMIGLSKHRKSGHSTNTQFFTGKKGGKEKKRRGKGLTRKQRRASQGTHINKYKV